MEIKIENYKEFEIVYVEGYKNGFEIKGQDVNKQKLSDLRKYIDRIKSNKFKRFKTFKIDYADRTEEVEVISYDEAGYFWVKDSKGRREKVSSESLLKANQNNVDKLNKIGGLRDKLDELREEKKKIVQNLEKLNPKDHMETKEEKVNL